jgi:hypothetical protein
MPLEIVVGAVVGAAAASAVNSPPIRQGVRKGVVYSLAGLLVAYDHASSLAKGVVQGARQVVKSSAHPETTPECAAAPPGPALSAASPAPATTNSQPS